MTLFAAMTLVLGACGSDKERERLEARELMRQLDALEGDAPLAQRKQQLDALVLLRLESAENRKAREVCYSAHKGLLDAEIEQATAKQIIDAVEKGPGPGPTKPTPEQNQKAADAIARSNDALAAAQKHFPGCEAAMRALITRAR